MNRGLLLVYVLIMIAIISIHLGFTFSGLINDPSHFEWAILYFGSAVIQAYATIIAIPFTIWVIYMQTRYGVVFVRLFLNRIIYPFTILGIISTITAITMSLEKTVYAYQAFMVEFIATLFFLPPIIHYIRELMTISPEKIVYIIRKTIKDRGEAIASSLHILRLALIEGYPDERAINNILKMIRDDTVELIELKPNPDTYFKFRDLLRTIVLEGTYLPDIRVMRDLFKNMLRWVVVNRKFSIARAFMRYYRLVTLRYMDETLPSTTIEYLYIEPVINNLRSLKARRSLIGYSIEQLTALLQRVKRAGEVGDVTALEICHIVDYVDKTTSGLENLKEYEKLRRLLNELRGEFLCGT
ncbi:MAG: hypothetical protein B6U89_04185 [Desulfurococcales archaeon ex4484_58]|nr:MAG: hypothetical protein B6U89_04185 [Desulfurococcales archaeon ex4484_58]